MPLYDCDSPDCVECQQAFGPDRTAAIAQFERRAKAYADLEWDQDVWDGEVIRNPSAQRYPG